LFVIGSRLSLLHSKNMTGFCYIVLLLAGNFSLGLNSRRMLCRPDVNWYARVPRRNERNRMFAQNGRDVKYAAEKGGAITLNGLGTYSAENTFGVVGILCRSKHVHSRFLRSLSRSALLRRQSYKPHLPMLGYQWVQTVRHRKGAASC
jgi:hypothetical protein